MRLERTCQAGGADKDDVVYPSKALLLIVGVGMGRRQHLGQRGARLRSPRRQGVSESSREYFEVLRPGGCVSKEVVCVAWV